MADPSLPSAVPAARLDEEETYVPPDDLGRAVAISLKWKFFSQVTREATRITTAVVLARLLTPAEWGVATMALIFAPLLLIIPDSITGGLVQRASITERDRSTVFWTAVGLGVSISLLGIAASGAVANLFDEPQVADLFKAVSVGFVISSFAVVPEALLMRDLAYRDLEIRQMVATLMGAIVALVLAFAGAGSWAIIGNSLAVVTTSAALLWWFVRWRPRVVFSSASFSSFGSYGIRMLGSQLLTYAQLSADKLLVGRFLGANSLGSYAFAFNLMFAPMLNLAYPLQQVLFPAYSTIQEDPDRLRKTWLRGKRLTVAVLAPAFLLILVVAPDLITVVFGAKWEDAIPVLQLLCIAGVAFSLSTQDVTLLLVLARMKTVLRWSFTVLVVMVIAVIVGLSWGIVGVAASYAVAQWLLVLPEIWITTRAASIRLRRALRAVFSPLPVALAATGAAYLVREALVAGGVPGAIRLVIVSAVLLAVYAVLVSLTAPELRREVVSGVRRARGRMPESLT